MVEPSLVMVVSKDEVVMALEDSVAEPEAEPLSVADPEAEPVAEGVPDYGMSDRVLVGWTKHVTYEDGGRNADTSGCATRRDQFSVQLWRVVCTTHHLHWQ